MIRFNHAHRRAACLALAAWLSTAAAFAWGATPLGTSLSYQGLLNENGTGVSGQRNMVFSLWDEAGTGAPPTGGTQVGSNQNLPNVEITNGLFTVELNGAGEFGANAFSGEKRWLQIGVDGTTLSPRQQITAAPAAQFSLESAQWKSVGSAITNANTGFVGINRTNTVGLEWFGVHAPVNAGYGGMYVTTEGATAWPFYGYRAGSQVAWTYLDGATGDWHLNVDGNRITATDEGNVGIGTASPTYKLHVTTNAAAGRSVFGSHTATSGTTYGGYFSSASTLGIGVAGLSPNIGVEGQASGASGIGVFGSGPSRGVFGTSSNNNSMAGEFIASGSNSRGVYGAAGAGGFAIGVYGEITDPGSAGTGVYGKAPSYGVTGEATGNGVGVIGRAPSGTGVYGESGVANGTGVMGANTAASGTTYGVQGIASSPAGYAGYFSGRGYFSGNVGLGTLSPTNPLSVAGSADITGPVSIGITGADARLLVRGIAGEDAFRVRVEGGTKLLVKDNGGVGIGSNFGSVPTDGLRVLGSVGIGVDPTDKLHVSGNIRATGSVFASCGTLVCSDGRYKTNLKPVESALELIQSLRPVRFDWKREEYPHQHFPGDRQLGLIAQEVQQVAPEVVQKGSDGYLAVDYGRLTPLLVEALKEVRAEKDTHINRLRVEQERQMETLRADHVKKDRRIAELEARLERIEMLFAESTHSGEKLE